MPHASSIPNCPECGLSRDAKAPPRPRFWTLRRAGPLFLALALLLAVCVGSALTVYRSSGPGGSFGYPAFLGVPNGDDLGPGDNFTTVARLQAIAAGEAPPTFTIDEVIAQAEDRAPDPAPASHLLAHAWDNARGQVIRVKSFGWPWGWVSDLEFCNYRDLRTLTFDAEGLATPRIVARSYHSIEVRHAGHASYTRSTTFGFVMVLVVVAWALLLASIAALVAAWLMRRRDPGRRARLALLIGVGAFLLMCAVGLGLPRSQEKAYAYPDASRRQETDLNLADLRKLRSAPDPERAVARALLNALNSKPMLGFTAAPSRRGDEPGTLQPPDPANLVLISFHDPSKATVHRTYAGWPLAFLGWERTERQSPAPELEESHAWRFKMRSNGPQNASLTRQDKGDPHAPHPPHPPHPPHIVRSIIVPLPFAFNVGAMIFGPPILVASVLALRLHFRTQRRRKHARCLGCGYELAGLDRGKPSVADAAP